MDKKENSKEPSASVVPPQQPAAQPKKTNTLAIVGLILAFFIPLIGLILSIVGLSQIKKRGEGGSGLAIAGIVISGIILLFQIIFFASIVGGIATSTTTSNSSNSDNKTSSTESKPAEVAKIGQPVRDGKFEFTVTGIECGKTSVGSNPYLTKTAQGQFCLLNMTVKNIGNESQLFSDSAQLLFDASGKKYSADSSASLYANPSGSTWFNQINPGNSVSGAVVFDIPKDVTPIQAELHDSSFSSGVKVNLQ